MELVLLSKPYLFAYVGVLLLLFFLPLWLRRFRFPCFILTLLISASFLLHGYFLGTATEELLIIALASFCLSVLTSLISKKQEERKP